MDNIIVSVVIPVYNEEKHIEKCVKSLLEQDYPAENMECVFADGMSTDRTVEILNGYAEKYPNLIKVVNNPHKVVTYAVNIAISNSVGKYIVRLDAHSDYAKDYISKCVYHLENTDADNVGGVAETKAFGFVGNAIAKMLSSKFGVGNSQFRTAGEDGYVDTVPFGAFRREVFEKLGLFDERLIRSEDNEMNYRIRKNGGKIYMSNDIKLTYYCRDTVKALLKMAFGNGFWTIITMKVCPGTMGLRHFIPFAFVMSVIGLSALSFLHIIFLWLLLAEMILYFALGTYSAVEKTKSIKEILFMLVLYPLFHCAYGIGSLCGLTKLFSKKYKKDYVPPKLKDYEKYIVKAV